MKYEITIQHKKKPQGLEIYKGNLQGIKSELRDDAHLIFFMENLAPFRTEYSAIDIPKVIELINNTMKQKISGSYELGPNLVSIEISNG